MNFHLGTLFKHLRSSDSDNTCKPPLLYNGITRFALSRIALRVSSLSLCILVITPRLAVALAGALHTS